MPPGQVFADFPTGIIIVRQPGWTAHQLRHHSLISLPGYQSRREPPYTVDRLQVRRVLQVQYSSWHPNLSFSVVGNCSNPAFPIPCVTSHVSPDGLAENSNRSPSNYSPLLDWLGDA